MLRNMNRSKNVVLVVAAGVMLVIAGCVKKQSKEETVQNVEKIVLPVKAAVASKQDIAKSLKFSGTIDAFKRAVIAPATPGSRVRKIYVEEGQLVRSGQLLATMEDYQLQQSAANLNQLQADYERIKILHERGSVTSQQLDQIKAGYEAAKAGYELLKNSVELRAPYSGTIIGRYFNEGEVYNGAPGAAGVAAIVELAQLERMKIEIMVPEQEFVLLRPGQATIVKVDAYPDTVFEGKVYTVNPSLNRMSRTSRVAIEISNPGKLLKPGMFAKVEVVTSTKSGVLAIPSTALVRRDGETYVFTVANKAAPFETKPSIVKVATGMSNDNLTEIVTGVNEGDVVLTENNVSLAENTDINVVSIEAAVKE